MTDEPLRCEKGGDTGDLSMAGGDMKRSTGMRRSGESCRWPFVFSY
jgi:hypothetical protein